MKHIFYPWQDKTCQRRIIKKVRLGVIRVVVAALFTSNERLDPHFVVTDYTISRAPIISSIESSRLFWLLFVSGGCALQSQSVIPLLPNSYPSLSGQHYVDFSRELHAVTLFQLPSNLQRRREGL